MIYLNHPQLRSVKMRVNKIERENPNTTTITQENLRGSSKPDYIHGHAERQMKRL